MLYQLSYILKAKTKSAGERARRRDRSSPEPLRYQRGAVGASVLVVRPPKSVTAGLVPAARNHELRRLPAARCVRPTFESTGRRDKPAMTVSGSGSPIPYSSNLARRRRDGAAAFADVKAQPWSMAIA